MRYFFDTEFIEDGKTIDLISIGIVCEDGREFYAVNEQCKFSLASDWVLENVLKPMGISRGGINKFPPYMGESHNFALQQTLDHAAHKRQIAEAIKEFCHPLTHGKPEFWGYYADYDWVVFCQLFGTMMDLPPDFPMYCNDIKQWQVQLGNPDIPRQETGEHNALEDARWNKKAFEFLAAIARQAF